MPVPARRKRILIMFAAAAIAAAVFLAGEAMTRHEATAEARIRLENELTDLANRLHAEIDSSVDLGRGLAAVIAAHHGISQQEFIAACDMLMAQEPEIRNIALVTGSVISINCPMAQNAATIGIDLRQRKDQWPSFERMQHSGAPDISGPVDLLQGGWTIIARIPIFFQEATAQPAVYWGALSIPLKIDGLFEAAGLMKAAQRLEIAIRGNRNATSAPEILFGEPSVFAGDPVVIAIPFPDGAWHIAGRVPPHELSFWANPPRHIAAALTALMCGLLFLVVALYADRRRGLESESNRNRDLLRALMQNSPIAMYVKDLEGHYLDLNEEAFRAYNMSGWDFRGRTAKDFVKPELAAQLALDDARALKGEVVRTERRSDESSKYMWEREIKFPVLDAGGKPIAIAGYVLDITSQKQAETRMLEALRHAESANREKSRFLATMSHELRTPLNAIIGFSDILRREMFGPIGHETYQTYATDIHKSGQLLFDLLGGIIDLSAVEAGHLDIKSESLTPDQVISDCRAVLEALARERDHTIEIHVSTTDACRGDRRLMRQVIINLTSNAAKYTRKGGKIDVIVAAIGTDVVFRVGDNGIGMAPDDIDRALQPFTRLGDPMRAEVGGSGIGLALVKRLVEAMQGTLTITSAPDIGTTVEVRLPRI